MFGAMNDLHLHHEILDRLGAPVLRQALGVKGPRVANWRRRGIPATFLLPVKALAEAHDVPVPGDFLAALGVAEPQGEAAA
jgi:hypothetical protein